MENFKMTRGELGSVLSAQMETRTLRVEGYEDYEEELTNDWQVVFIETDKFGVLNIYCKP